MKPTFTKSELTELELIGKYQPIPSGKICSKPDAESLINKGYVMRYEGEYVLTEKGKEQLADIDGARKLAAQSLLIVKPYKFK